MKIVCFGDSNTFGYDATSFFGDRLPRDERWADIISDENNWTVLNFGENGRMIPHGEWDYYDIDTIIKSHNDFDFLIIMLGSNDLCMTSRPNMDKIKLRMEAFLDYIISALNKKHIADINRKILLVAPTPVSVDFPGQSIYDPESKLFGSTYKKIASDKNLLFADAGSFNITLAHDGIHFNSEGHKTFAAEISKIIRAASSELCQEAEKE